MNEADDAIWQDIFAGILDDGVTSNLDKWSKVQDKLRIISRALGIPHQRAVAMRLIRQLDENFKIAVFPMLLDHASVESAELNLCRDVILGINRNWLLSNMDQHSRLILQAGGLEEFLRLGELFEKIDPMLLQRHIDFGSASSDPRIREAAEDFRGSISAIEEHQSDKVLLYTVEGYHISALGLGLLRGVPEYLMQDRRVQQAQQGSALHLILPNGDHIRTHISNYYTRLSLNQNEIAPDTRRKIIIVPDKSLRQSDVPVGTQVWLISSQGKN